MGMAASQARYLGLTARKTNVEYEGQQINQARTALGNQSATLWNQQLGLSIPTCPNMMDYTKVQYSFSDGYNDFTISTLQSCDYTDPETGIRYNTQVTYYYNQDVFKAVQNKNSNPQVQYISDDWSYTTNVKDKPGSVSYKAGHWEVIKADGTSITVGAEEVAEDSDEYKGYLKANNLENLDPSEKLWKYTYNDSDGEQKTVYLRGNEVLTDGTSCPTQTIKNNPHYMLGNSPASLYDPNNPEQKEALAQIRNDFKNEKIAGTPDDQIWVYQKNGQTYFATKEELEACMHSTDNKIDDLKISSPIDYQSVLNQYYTGTVSEQITNTEYAIMDDASGSGRFSNIKLQSMSTEFKLKSEEVTNEKAYNDAMNQYNYDVTCYEKAMADINAKTKVIQEQDRQLELRLKQLDTEQKALTSEMDAVKGIIQKNVESTFKTFS
ncbi:MAG: hypothetical protein ACI37S_02760 [Candidatus Gastranaerophilaceae bacterium]